MNLPHGDGVNFRLYCALITILLRDPPIPIGSGSAIDDVDIGMWMQVTYHPGQQFECIPMKPGLLQFGAGFVGNRHFQSE